MGLHPARPASDELAVRVNHDGVCLRGPHTLDAHGVSGGAGSAAGRPVVLGDEPTGVVTVVGHAVERSTVGDPVTVGDIVYSVLEGAA